jgi:hypothetical protein
VPSVFFNEIAEILSETSLQNQAFQILENQCQNINVTPEELLPKDSVSLMLGMMTSIGELLDGGEWEILDNQLKNLLNKYEDKPFQGKVKGDVLGSILDYVFIKGGKQSLNQIRTDAGVVKDPWVETWYPISFLSDIFSAIEIYMGLKKGLRCREIGNHVISRLDFLFKSDDSKITLHSFQKLKDIINLKDFIIYEEPPSTVIVEFFGGYSQSIVEFFEGLCEGVFTLEKGTGTLNIFIGTATALSKIIITLREGVSFDD